MVIRQRPGVVNAPDGLLAQRGATEKSEAPAAGLSELSEEDKKAVAGLKRRDQEVRQHERAHASVGGQFAGQPSFKFERGPDGRQYAVEGEVPIDIKPVAGDPEATIRKMEIVKAAALAPGTPSGQDRTVAAQAEAARLEAQSELNASEEEGAENEALTGAPKAETPASEADRDGPGPEVRRAVAAYQGALDNEEGSSRDNKPKLIEISIDLVA